MKLSEELQTRGFIHQHTGDSLTEVLDTDKRVVYHGIDPSADSAHAGNMVVWMLLRHLTNNGHKVIFLVGGGTGMIGDPKPDAERTLSDEQIVEQNVEQIREQAQRLIGGDAEVEFVNNADWLLKQNLITFLRDIGKHFTVNELVKKEAIAARLESDTGLSYTEFAYPLLQGFDYLTLHREKGCDLQVGGSDQWGNIVSGVDLIRRKEQTEVHAVTVPLVVDKATGKKFGKSEGNAIWLDPEKTTPFTFFQFWFNTSDESVVDYLKLFTFLSLDEVEEIERDFNANPGARTAQRKLAFEVTMFVHGKENAELIDEVSQILFGNQSASDISESARQIILDNAPVCNVQQASHVVDVLVESELASSKREARTFIESGAVSINDTKIDSVEAVLTDDIFHNGIAILRRGKKNLSVLLLEM